MLTFTLKKQWFEKIKSGEKTVEYREVKPYWTKRIENYKYHWGQFIKPKDFKNWFNNFPTVFYSPSNPGEKAVCFLRLGYTDEILSAEISKIEIVDGSNTDLRINKPVYAFHLKNIKEVER